MLPVYKPSTGQSDKKGHNICPRNAVHCNIKFSPIHIYRFFIFNAEVDSKKRAFKIYVECILKIGRNYYFNLTHVGLKYAKLKSVWADQDTRTAGTICPNIYLANLGAVR